MSAEIHKLNMRVKTIQIRQAARKAFDLSAFGTGSFERMLSAMILAAVFALSTLLLGSYFGLKTEFTIALLAVAIISVMGTSAVLIMWSSDDALANELAQVRSKAADLREQQGNDPSQNPAATSTPCPQLRPSPLRAQEVFSSHISPLGRAAQQRKPGPERFA